MDNPEMRRNRILGVFIFAAILVGASGLVLVTQRPEFASVRTVDALQLVASGMCFGVALVALVAVIRGRRCD